MEANLPPLLAILPIVNQKLTWFGTVRGRLGEDVGPALIYATGGLAYGNVQTNVSQNIFGLNTGGSASEIQTGWTLGAGIEAPVARNWTAKAEYLYMDVGSQSVAFNTPNNTTVTLPFRDNIFRFGLNYQFGPAILR